MQKRRYWEILIALVFIVILVGVATTIDFSQVYVYFQSAQMLFVLLAFVSAFLYYVFLALNYVLFFRVPFSHAIFVQLSGEFFNVISPGINVAGEPLKGYLLSKLTNKPFTEQFSRTFSLKVVDGLWYAFFFAFALIYSVFFLNLPEDVTIAAQIIFSVLLFASFVIVVRKVVVLRNFFEILSKIFLGLLSGLYKYTFMPSFNFLQREIGFVSKLLSAQKSVHEKIKSAVKKFVLETKNAFKRMFIHKKLFFMIFFFNFIGWVFFFLKTLFVFYAFGQDVAFVVAILAWMLPSFFGSVIFVPGGIGVTEALMVALYYQLGVQPELGVAIAAIDRLIFYTWALLFGSSSFWFLKFWKKI